MSTWNRIEILKLSQAIAGEKGAFEWLLQNRKELAAWYELFTGNRKSAYEWLKQHKYMTLLAFHFALKGSEKARAALVNARQKALVAVLHLLDNDRKAFDWLTRNELSHYAFLAKTIKEFWEQEITDGDDTFDDFG